MPIWPYQLLTGRTFIETGRVILSGTAKELQASEEIKNAYLGGH